MCTCKNKTSIYYILIVAAALLMGMVNMGQAVMQAAVLPFLMSHLALSYSSTSLMLTVRSAFTVIATLVTDKIYQRFGIRKGIVLAFLCSIASTLVYGIARNFGMCLAAIALSGFAFGLGGTIPAAVLMRRWFVRRRGLVLGLCAMSSGVTSLLLSVPVTRIVSEKGIFAAETTMAVLFSIMAVIVIVLVREYPQDVGLTAYGENLSPRDTTGQEPSQCKYHPLDEHSKRHLYVAMVFCGFFTYCSWDNFNLAAIAAGYDAVFIGSVMALNGLTNMLGKPLYGVLADTVSAPAANVLYYGLLILAHLCIVLMNGVSSFPVYCMVICLGLGCFTISTVGTPFWVAELSDETEYTATLKKLQSACTIGGLCMSPFPGILADQMGNYNAYYLFCALTTTASLVLVNSVYHRQRRNP